MTKSDLIDMLCETEKMPKGRAELLINAIFDCMEAALRNGDRIEIRGFGSFEIRSYRAYEGRNPRTGSAVSVKPKRLPFFKVGKELKERVNVAATKAAVAKAAALMAKTGAAPAAAAAVANPTTPAGTASSTTTTTTTATSSSSGGSSSNGSSGGEQIN
ncbi:MAG TPA: HU family DNA-binding protein [Polyangia bacterium]|jgi:integration host factor subunit beta|nr:HU family DNA-binding protein [Polyangia bacterium]